MLVMGEYKLSGDTGKAELVLITLLGGGGKVNHSPGENSDQTVLVLLSLGAEMSR